MSTLIELPDRFWAKVVKTPTCWLWTAGGRDGYGAFTLIKKVGPRQAHRFAYESLVGPIPDGLVIDHLCRVRNCVNPDHLEPVTNAENVLRGYSGPAINARKESCNRGHAFDEPNTWIEKNGKRHCRTCHREKDRKVRARTTGAVECHHDECSRSFKNEHALGVHVRRAHGGA